METVAKKIEYRGVVELTNDEYHSAPGISKSGLDHLRRSPAHFQAYIAKKYEPTPAMLFGAALHCAILEPDKFSGLFGVAPPKIKRNDYAAWVKDNPDLTAISQDQMDAITEIQANVMSHPVAKELFLDGVAEKSIFWLDLETGALCKCRPDFLRSDGVIIDLKSTDDARPQAFQRSIANYRYHVQSAYYMDGVTLGTNRDDIDTFVFVTVEKDPPYAVAVYMMDDEAIIKGRSEYRHDLAKYADCKRLNRWPSYDTEIKPITLPAWHKGE